MQVHDSLQNLREYGAVRHGLFRLWCNVYANVILIVSLFTRLRDRKNGVQEYAKRPELFTFSACNSCIMRHFYQSDDCINYLVNISVVKNSGHEKRVISSHA